MRFALESDERNLRLRHSPANSQYALQVVTRFMVAA
jgi:hypothetical protein